MRDEPFEKRGVTAKDVWLGLSVFTVVVAVGAVALFAKDLTVLAAEYWPALLLVLLVALLQETRRLLRRSAALVWRSLRGSKSTKRTKIIPGPWSIGGGVKAAAIDAAPSAPENGAPLHRMWCGEWVEVGAPVALSRPWVIDGDTIDDRAVGIRYRLANIDAPETGDNAKCEHERRCGERAGAYAVGVIRNANAVTVRKTARIDAYGRCVAFVFVDGKDLGEILVARGLAKSWRGKREPWCGAQGLLAQLAMQRREPFDCTACPLQQEPR